MARLFLCGYFGFGNTGDEALLEATVAWLRARRPGLEIAVLSAAPERTARLGVEPIARGSVRRLVGAVRCADVVALGPGGLFQDLTSVRSNFYYAAIAYLARLWSKPLALVGHGLGPLRSPLARRAAAGALRRAQVVSVRDEPSAALAAELAPSCRPRVAADVAFLLPSDEGRNWRAEVAQAVERPGAVVGVCPRLGGAVGEEDLRRLAEALRGAARGRRVAWLVLPFGGPADERPSQTLARLLDGEAAVWRERLAPSQWLGLVGALDGLVAMRYHAVLFAARCGVPVAGVACDPKITFLLEQLGCAPAADFAQRAPWSGAEARIAEELFAEGRGEELRRAAGQLAERAAEALQPLLELL